MQLGIRSLSSRFLPQWAEREYLVTNKPFLIVSFLSSFSFFISEKVSGREHRVPGDRTPVGPGEPGRGNQVVRAAHVGGAELQAGQTRPGLVTVSSEKRPGHPAALATGLLRLLVLLVSRLSPLLQRDGRCERSI